MMSRGYNGLVNDDPFQMIRQGGIFGQMDGLMGGGDPYYGGGPFLGNPFGQMFGQQQLMPMMPFQSPFAGMMSPLMNDLSRGAGGGDVHSFSSSSVMTMSTGPDGRPQVYQSSSSSRSVPGGVKETRRTESNSQTGVRKMAIGHHINERGHIIEKEMHGGGDMEERQEFLNIDEGDASRFDAEFRRKTGGHPSAIKYRGPSPSEHSRSTYLQALPSARRRENLLAIGSNASGQDDGSGQRERKQRRPRNK